MRHRLGATTVLATIAALLLAAPAQADFQTLYNDYRTDGMIDGCAYSAGELSSGLTDIPADVREYDPGFTDAINAALEQRAAGCGTAPLAATTKNEVTASDGSPGPAAPHALTIQAGVGGRSMPAVLVAVIALLGAVLGAAAVLAIRRRGPTSNL
jgi:hypothetical protein